MHKKDKMHTETQIIAMAVRYQEMVAARGGRRGPARPGAAAPPAAAAMKSGRPLRRCSGTR
eukprot:1426071-Alexandrium_andersonii.AAC.1